MDKMVEEAFRLNVKWSLQELSKAINGDGKSAPNPLFRVKVCLEGDKVSQLHVGGLLFISYKFVKGFLAITFLFLVISSFYNVCQHFLYNQE